MKNKNPRPPLLTLLIIAGLIGCFFNMFLVHSPSVRNVSSWYPLYLSLSTLAVIIFLGAVGMMRKWGVIGYSLYAAIHQGVHLYLGLWNGTALILPAAVTVTGWIYYKRMD
ncbi:MAG TPA: hypothetical protein VMV05_02205 [bacterium]|nr:hypothetical protein [bacterium]